MPRGSLSLLAAAVLLVAAAPAGAQSPFAPVPAAPQQTQTQATTTSSVPGQGDGGLSTWQSALIVLGGVALIGGIGFAIARDARMRARDMGLSDTVPGDEAGGQHKTSQRSKQKQRAKQKAARAQRRRNR